MRRAIVMLMTMMMASLCANTGQLYPTPTAAPAPLVDATMDETSTQRLHTTTAAALVVDVPITIITLDHHRRSTPTLSCRGSTTGEAVVDVLLLQPTTAVRLVLDKALVMDLVVDLVDGNNSRSSSNYCSNNKRVVGGGDRAVLLLLLRSTRHHQRSKDRQVPCRANFSTTESTCCSGQVNSAIQIGRSPSSTIGPAHHRTIGSLDSKRQKRGAFLRQCVACGG